MAALEFSNIFTPNIQARHQEEQGAAQHRPVMLQVQEKLEKMMAYCINTQSTRCLQRVQFIAMALAFYSHMLGDMAYSKQFSQMAGHELNDDDFRNIFLTNPKRNTGSIRESLGDGKIYSTQFNLGDQNLANVAASLRKATQRCNFDNMSKLSRTPVVLLLVLHKDAMQHLKPLAKVLLQSLAYDMLLQSEKTS